MIDVCNYRDVITINYIVKKTNFLLNSTIASVIIILYACHYYFWVKTARKNC